MKGINTIKLNRDTMNQLVEKALKSDFLAQDLDFNVTKITEETYKNDGFEITIMGKED